MAQTQPPQQLQESECTVLNRYPEIFNRAVASLIGRRHGKPAAVLSFGCSMDVFPVTLRFPVTVLSVI